MAERIRASFLERRTDGTRIFLVDGKRVEGGKVLAISENGGMVYGGFNAPYNTLRISDPGNGELSASYLTEGSAPKKD